MQPIAVTIFILVAENSQILPKTPIIPILLTFMYLVALRKQSTQLIIELNSSSRLIIVTNKCTYVLSQKCNAN